MKEIRNAEITGTMLGYEDREILTIFLYLDCGDFIQGFGGYALDDYSKNKKERIPMKICGTWIREILNVVGVKTWEDLRGKYVRIEGDSGEIYRIGNLLKDVWFDPNNIKK
jgi:hypothetical protein